MRAKISFLFVGISSYVHGQWTTNTQLNTPICTLGGKQNDVRIIGDGSGGSFLAWKDARQSNSNPDIYLQYLNYNGFALWESQGVPVCTDTSDQSTPNLCSDQNGGVIVTWSDLRSGGERDVYAQRVNASGDILWSFNGVPVANKAIREHNEKIASDESSGAYVFWEQEDTITGLWKICGQHLNSSGQRSWDSNGIPVSTSNSNQLNVKIQKDGVGGIYAVWQDALVVGDYNIYAQHLNVLGEKLWGDNGLLICGASGSQINPKLDPDSVHNGIYVAWVDQRNGLDYDIYAQSISDDGLVQWSPNGNIVCSTVGNQSAVDIVSTTSIQGLVLVWKDSRNGLADIYAQKMNPIGQPLWAANGIVVSNEPFAQLNPNICSDGNGGVICTWQDSTWNDWDVKAQRISSQGFYLWDLGGVVVSDAIEIQAHPKNIADGNGGSIFAWQDKRANQYDIYAHHLNADGTGGVLIRENKIETSLLWPNPGDQDGSGFQSTSQVLHIFNVQGREIRFSQEQRDSFSWEVKLSCIDAGMYLIFLDTGETLKWVNF